MPWVLADRPSLADLNPGESPVDWWVVFIDAEESYWWTRLLRPGFSHCYALRQMASGWLLVDPRLDFIDVLVLDHPPWATIQAVVPAGTTVVHVHAWRREGTYRHPWVFGPVTCVELVKALLGIRAFWLWTPWQLYRHLKGATARE